MLRRAAVLRSKQWSGPLASKTTAAGATRGVVDDYSAARALKRAVGDRRGGDRRTFILKALLNCMAEYEALGARLGKRTFGVAMGECANQGLGQLCDKLFAMMKAKGLAPDVATYNMLLKAHRVDGNYASVCFYWGLLNSTPPLRPDQVSHIEYIKASLRHQVPRATLYGMVDAAMVHFSTPKAKLALYTLILPGLPMKGALALHRGVLAEGLRPDLVYYTALLTVAAKAPGDEAFAEDVMRAVHSTAGVIPDLTYYNAVLQVYQTTLNLPKCVAVLKLIDKAGMEPNVTTFNRVITTCAHCADGDAQHPAIDFAALTFRTAMQRGFGAYATLHYSMLELYHSIGDAQGVKQTASQARGMGHGIAVTKALRKMTGIAAVQDPELPYERTHSADRAA
eukprot:TRINITY_DN905_c1_g1_i1.p1 TRINITY_DN905_c1_g1~~TRINITY_DN905_c1_g1_i1.p1  ORF type:complete len:396 (+),score=108.65 TRINITY_DN905_c1_g1_i1:77-1264(+)